MGLWPKAFDCIPKVTCMQKFHVSSFLQNIAGYFACLLVLKTPPNSEEEYLWIYRMNFVPTVLVRINYCTVTVMTIFHLIHMWPNFIQSSHIMSTCACKLAPISLNLECHIPLDQFHLIWSDIFPWIVGMWSKSLFFSDIILSSDLY